MVLQSKELGISKVNHFYFKASLVIAELIFYENFRSYYNYIADLEFIRKNVGNPRFVLSQVK
jgi:hypothetical protein